MNFIQDLYVFIVIAYDVGYQFVNLKYFSFDELIMIFIFILSNVCNLIIIVFLFLLIRLFYVIILVILIFFILINIYNTDIHFNFDQISYLAIFFYQIVRIDILNSLNLSINYLFFVYAFTLLLFVTAYLKYLTFVFYYILTYFFVIVMILYQFLDYIQVSYYYALNFSYDLDNIDFLILLVYVWYIYYIFIYLIFISFILIFLLYIHNNDDLLIFIVNLHHFYCVIDCLIVV